MQQAELTPWPQAPEAVPEVGAQFRPSGSGMTKFVGAAAAVVGVIVIVNVWRAAASGQWGFLSLVFLVVLLALLWAWAYFSRRRLVVSPTGLVRQGMGASKLLVPWDQLATVVLVPSVQAGTEPARAYLYFLDHSGQKIALLYSPLWDGHTLQEVANNVPPVQRFVVSQPIERKQLKGIPGFPGLSKQL